MHAFAVSYCFALLDFWNYFLYFLSTDFVFQQQGSDSNRLNIQQRPLSFLRSHSLVHSVSQINVMTQIRGLYYTQEM